MVNKPLIRPYFWGVAFGGAARIPMNSGRHTHTSHIGRIRGPTVIPNEVGRSVEAIVEVGGSPGEAREKPLGSPVGMQDPMWGLV